MSKVYIVTCGEYSDYSISAAFSTRKKAEAYCALHTGGYDPYMVEEYELDEPEIEDVRICYRFRVEFPDKPADRIDEPRYLLLKDAAANRKELAENNRKWCYDRDRRDIVTGRYHIGRYVYLKENDPELALKIVRDRIAKAKAEQAGL